MNAVPPNPNPIGPSPVRPRPVEPSPTAPIVDPAALPAARKLRTRCAALGLPPRAARPGAARPGDAIVLVGAIGRGGAAVLAAACGPWLGRRVPPADLVQAEGWPDGPGWDVALVAGHIEHLLAAVGIEHGTRDRNGAIHALIALGDGGLARACQAVARASDVELWIDAGAVPLHASTARICDALGLNPLDVQSAGTLLFTAPPHLAKAVADRLAAAGHDAVVVGRVAGAPCAVTLVMGGSRRPLRSPPRDAVDAVLEPLPVKSAR